MPPFGGRSNAVDGFVVRVDLPIMDRGPTQNHPIMKLPIPTRTLETQATYLREGERHLQRALCIWPIIECPFEALAVSIEADNTILKASTIRRYRQEIDAILDFRIADEPEQTKTANGVRMRIMAALNRRRGRPPCKRTSSLKVRDAMLDECTRVLAHLHLRAEAATTTGLDHLLPPFLIAAPRLGLRPVEWIGARVEGNALIVPCAKATNGRACSQERQIGLGGFEAGVVAAVSLVVELLPSLLMQYGGWTRLRDALAERLARACKRAGVRRLSPYSFRHVAMATWKASGLDPVSIAALAGHKSTRMQKGYAGSRHGWTAEAGLPQPDPALVALIAGNALGVASEPAPSGTEVVQNALANETEPALPKERSVNDEQGAESANGEEHPNAAPETGSHGFDPFQPMPLPVLRPVLGSLQPPPSAAVLFADFTYRFGSSPQANCESAPKHGANSLSVRAG